MEKAAYFGPLYPVLHQLTQGWYVPQYGAAFLSLLLIHSAPMYQCLLRAKSYTWGTPAHISCWYMTYCTTFPLQCKSNAQLCKSMGHSPLIIWWEDKSTTQCAQDSQTGERWRHFLIKPREETFICSSEKLAGCSFSQGPYTGMLVPRAEKLKSHGWACNLFRQPTCFCVPGTWDPVAVAISG